MAITIANAPKSPTACPNCGYDAQAGLNKKQAMGMNNYFNSSSGLKSVFNRDEDKFTVGEGDLAQTWIRGDIFAKMESDKAIAAQQEANKKATAPIAAAPKA